MSEANSQDIEGQHEKLILKPAKNGPPEADEKIEREAKLHYIGMSWWHRLRGGRDRAPVYSRISEHSDIGDDSSSAKDESAKEDEEEAFVGKQPRERAESMSAAAARWYTKWRGELFLFAFTICLSSNNSVYKFIYQMDSNTFDSTTVICAANLLGFLMLAAFYSATGELRLEALSYITQREWVFMTFGTLLYACAGPQLLLLALERTPVSD
jgi:hypothetical protein